MKKVALLLIMLFSVVLCATYGQAELDCSGTWYALKYEKGRQEYDAAEEGYNQVLAFYPTKKAIIEWKDGRYQEGKWSDLDRSIMVHFENEKSLIYFVEGDYLYTYEDGGTLWFKKETDLIEPNDIIQVSKEAYYGNWLLHKFKNNGIIMSLKMAGLSGINAKGSLTISEDKAYLELDFGKQPVTWDGEPVFSDGKIYFNKAEFTMTDTDELYLASNGVNYYFRRVDPVEGWYCKKCGNLANGNYCYNCGHAYSDQSEQSKLESLFSDEGEQPKEKFLYRGEYVIGTDLPPGVYVLSVNELEYDWLWEVNKAILRVYDYIESDRDWAQKESQTANKKNQRIRITVSTGQKITVDAGTFEIVDFSYRSPDETDKKEQEADSGFENVPWFDYGVGSKLPKPFSASGSALKTTSLASKNNDDELFYTTLNATKKDYDHYKQVLIDWGFNEIEEDSELFSTCTFKARNSEEYKVSLGYNPFIGMGVRIEAPGYEESSDM